MNNLHPIAQAVQSQGRGKDTQLIHMTPNEVQGLQALAMAHGGSLTINPSTGLPEAGFLKNILPMVAGVALGPAGFGMSALGAGLTVGGLTALTSGGDLGKGLMAGLGAWGGAGLGGAVAGMGSNAIGGQAASNATAEAALRGKAGAGAVANAARETAIQEATKSQILKEGARAAMSNPMGVVDSLGGFGGAAKVLGAASLPAMLSDQTATKMPDQKSTPTTVAQLEYRRNARSLADRDPNSTREYNYFEGPGYVKTGETTYAAQGGIMGYAQGGAPISGGQRANMSPEEYLNQYFSPVQTATRMPDTNKKAAGGIVSLAEGGSYTPYSAGYKPMTPEEFTRMYMEPQASPGSLPGGVSGYEGVTRTGNTNVYTPGTGGQSDIQTDADGRKYRLEYDPATGTYRKIYEEEAAPVAPVAPVAPNAPAPAVNQDVGGNSDFGGGVGNVSNSKGNLDSFLNTPIGRAVAYVVGTISPGTPQAPAPVVDMSTPYSFEAPVQGVPAPVTNSQDASGSNVSQASIDAANMAGDPIAALAESEGWSPGPSSGGGGFAETGESVSGSADAAADYGGFSDSQAGGGGFGPSAAGKMAQGGLLALAAGGMAKGGFVVPADVVSALGNGSTDAGLRALKVKLGAVKHIKGKGDGLSDSIPTSIDGKQPARVADGEAYIDPRTVAKIGGGDMKKGASKLYAMMDKVRQQAHGKKSQQRKVSPAKALSA